MHNKLVRDKIPDIIFDSGHPNHGAFKSVTGTELQLALVEKFDEELNEVRVAFYSQQADDAPDRVIEELVDVLEIAYSLAKMRGISNEALNEARMAKHEKRGGFELGFIMNTGNK